VSELRRIHLAPSAAVKQRRLEALRSTRGADDAVLRETVEDAQILGSLQLSGFDFSWEEVRVARLGEPAPQPLAGMRRALSAVPPDAPFTLQALLAWHGAVTGGASAFRATQASREGAPPPAPPERIAGRLEILEQWLGVETARELKPAQAGALVLARLIEILPFDDANGRVSRLAASHLVVRAGGRPPILVGADRPRLVEALQAAFQLETRPLAALLEEASERALDVMIQALEGRA
jgi:hypothetical protein